VENGREDEREGKEKGEKAKYFIQKDSTEPTNNLSNNRIVSNVTTAL
jgi:hypothetical protein